MNFKQEADLTVLSGGAVQRGLADLAQLFLAQSGRRVALEFATAPVIRRRIENQKALPDIVVAPLPDMREFEQAGRIARGSSVILGSVKAGVAVRNGASEPDISTAEALKREILACRSLVYNEGSSGIFVEKLLQRLGVADAVKSKTVRYPDAAGIMAHLVNSKLEKEVGFGQITAILLYADRGIRLVGPLPKEIESVTTYAGGICTSALDPKLAEQFLRFLVGPDSKTVFKATGVD